MNGLNHFGRRENHYNRDNLLKDSEYDIELDSIFVAVINPIYDELITVIYSVSLFYFVTVLLTISARN